MNKKTEFSTSGNVIEIDVTGQLVKEDFDRLVPCAEKLIEKFGKIRVLVVLDDFQGWTEEALLQDINFDLEHFADIERIAVVGAEKWSHGNAIFCRPYRKAEICYFDRDQADEARKWILKESSSSLQN